MMDGKDWVFTFHLPKYVKVGHVTLSTKRESRAECAVSFVRAFWKLNGFKSVSMANVLPYDDHTVYTMIARR